MRRERRAQKREIGPFLVAVQVFSSNAAFELGKIVFRTQLVFSLSSLLHKLSFPFASRDEDRMPPKGDPLSDKEVALLRAWIEEGMSWEPGFSFKGSVYVAPLKPRRPELPPAKPGLEHPIDRILDAYFTKTKGERPEAV